MLSQNNSITVGKRPSGSDLSSLILLEKESAEQQEPSNETMLGRFNRFLGFSQGLQKD